MIGTDIVEIARIKKAWKRHGEAFLHKVFTEQEIAYCLRQKAPETSLAARFAAKEAVAKALGTGFREGVGFKDIEIHNDVEGKPSVTLSGRFAGTQVWVSLSHCREYATAVALCLE